MLRKKLNLLKFNNYRGKFNSFGLGLTIAPTLSCNFACPYCYENIEGGFIGNEVKQKIYEQIEKFAKRKELVYITWYGGEPLIAKEIIWEMSEKIIRICDQFESPYSSHIISNGYLIDKQIVNLLKKSKITGAQITVDGEGKTYHDVSEVFAEHP